MFLDLKNRDWGLGMDKAKLTQKGRVGRHFLILALAYVFLVAFGAAAQAAGLGEKRFLSLARIGNYFLHTAMLAIPIAIQAVLELPT